jgi:hypothetical protein
MFEFIIKGILVNSISSYIPTFTSCCFVNCFADKGLFIYLFFIFLLTFNISNFSH